MRLFFHAIAALRWLPLPLHAASLARWIRRSIVRKSRCNVSVLFMSRLSLRRGLTRDTHRKPQIDAKTKWKRTGTFPTASP